MADPHTEQQLRLAKVNAFSAVSVAFLSATTGVAGIAGGLLLKPGSKQDPPAVVAPASGAVLQPLQAEVEQLKATNARLESQLAEAQQSRRPAAATAPPGISLSWLDERTVQSLDTVRCKELAQSSLQGSGATAIDTSPAHTVYAVKADYSLFVFCGTKEGVVVLGAAGPLTSIAQELQTRVARGFLPAPAPP